MSLGERFPAVVGIACHDLRTPLATVHGFAKTLERIDLDEPAARYVEMIDAASAQIAELLEELALVTRIELGRYEPRLEVVDSLVLAEEAAAELPEDAVNVTGRGSPVSVEAGSVRRAVRQLARAARRHGGLDSVDLVVDGARLELSPLVGGAAAVVTGADVRELGAAAAAAFIPATGGTVAQEGDRLVIVLPAAD
jgi:signal transduction histidine kinase